MTSVQRPVDRRLTWVAIGAWGATAGCTYLSPRWSLICAACGSFVALVSGRRIAVVTLVALGLLLGAVSSAWHVRSLRHGIVASMASHRATADVIARLVRDPLLVTTRTGSSLTIVDATVTSVLDPGWRKANAPITVLSYGAGWTDLLPGQTVEVVGTLAPPQRGDSVAAVLDARAPPVALGRPPWWQRVAGRVRARLRAAVAGLPPDERGLLPGLVDGDVSAEPATLTAAMRVTGLTHLQAVSGENVSVVLGVVLALARFVGLRRRSRVGLATLSLIAFVVLARPSPSVQRAAVMGGLVLLAALTGRRAQALPSLAAAVLLLVLVDPFLARSVGFVLSVWATAAILLLAPRWTQRLAAHLPSPLAAAIAIPAAAQIACTPVLVLVFGQLSPYAIPANVIAGLAVVPATILGVVAAVLASVSVTAAAPVAWLAALPTALVVGVARTFAAFPAAGLSWSGPVGFAAVGLGLVIASVWWARRHRVTPIAVELARRRR